MLEIIIKGVATVVDLPFLVLYFILSWPFSIFVGIHKLLFRNIEGCSDILEDAERYLSDRNRRRLSIFDQGNYHSVSSGTMKDSGEDTSSDESSEVYSAALDPSFWLAGNLENALLGSPSGVSAGKDDFFSSKSHKTSGAQKRTRSPPVMEVVQEDCKEAKKWLRDQCKHKSSLEEFTFRANRETFIFKAPKNDHVPMRCTSTYETPSAVGDFRSSISPLIPMVESSTKLTPAEDSDVLPAKARNSIRFRSNVSLGKVFKKAEDPIEPLSGPRARSNPFSGFRIKELVPKRLFQKSKTQTEHPASPSTVNRLSMKARERFSVYSGSFRMTYQTK